MKILKSRLFQFILTAIIFTGIGAIAENTISANQVTYTNSNNQETTVADALNDLYTKKLFSQITFLGKNTIIGNTTMTYTFDKDVDLGLVVVTASNDVNDLSKYTASIQSLTTGTYQLINDSTNSFTSNNSSAGHRSAVYIIENVKKDSVLTVATRWAGLVQVFEMS